MYFILGGWRDGEAGFAWCTLQGFYEYLIVLKVKELKRQQRSTAVQEAPAAVPKPSKETADKSLASHG